MSGTVAQRSGNSLCVFSGSVRPAGRCRRRSSPLPLALASAAVEPGFAASSSCVETPRFGLSTAAAYAAPDRLLIYRRLLICPLSFTRHQRNAGVSRKPSFPDPRRKSTNSILHARRSATPAMATPGLSVATANVGLPEEGASPGPSPKRFVQPLRFIPSLPYGA